MLQTSAANSKIIQTRTFRDVGHRSLFYKSMASFVRHFSRSLLQVSRRTPAKRKCDSQWHCTESRCRTFSSTSPWLADDDEDRKAPAITIASSKKKSNPFTPADFTPEERANFEQLSKEQQAAELTRINVVQDALDNGELGDEMDAEVAEMAREIDREVEPLRFVDYRARGQEVGFWADDEDDEFGQVEDDDDDFNEEDITSVAHSELEVHREMREYARIVAWDMPLLKSKLADLLALRAVLQDTEADFSARQNSQSHLNHHR
jgi:small subunit ribosomal protein S35